MCSQLGRRYIFSLALALLLALPSFSQSFDTTKTYNVTGSQLNALEKDLLVAKNESQTQKELSKKLNEQLEKSKSLLIEAQAQLTTASESLKTLKKETFEGFLIVGVAGLSIGLLLGFFY